MSKSHTESISVSPAVTTDYTVTVTDDFVPTSGPTASADGSGTVLVNAVVGCNDRIKLTDICRTEFADPPVPGFPVKLTFTYVNDSGFDFNIPFGGPDNDLKGRGNFILAEGEAGPPSLFPGDGVVRTFSVYTDDDNLQWEVVTPGCKQAAKSANGSKANPCDTSAALTSNVEVDSFSREFEENTPQAYPNPAIDYLTLFVGDMEGAVQVSVFDEAGRQLMSREYPVEQGQSEVYLDISALKEGILTIITENQGNRSAFRIIKQ